MNDNNLINENGEDVKENENSSQPRQRRPQQTRKPKPFVGPRQKSIQPVQQSQPKPRPKPRPKPFQPVQQSQPKQQSNSIQPVHQPQMIFKLDGRITKTQLYSFFNKYKNNPKAAPIILIYDNALDSNEDYNSVVHKERIYKIKDWTLLLFVVKPKRCFLNKLVHSYFFCFVWIVPAI